MPWYQIDRAQRLWIPEGTARLRLRPSVPGKAIEVPMATVGEAYRITSIR